MLETKYATIINDDGYKTKFVIIRDTLNEEGEIVQLPEEYIMQTGEQIISDDWQAANAMINPRWDGKKWMEMATTEEIEAYQEAIPTLIATNDIYARVDELENVLDNLLGSTDASSRLALSKIASKSLMR